jgi:glycosyltransferase involved in cell wall biosynthesis
MANVPEFSLIIETFTFLEGGDRSRFRKLLGLATDIVNGSPRGELLVADVVGSQEIAAILKDFPAARRIDAVGLPYDSAKMLAFRESSGPYVLYIDSDCLPGPNWQHHMLAALRREGVLACCGYTMYEGGFLAKLMAVMDWGFLYPRSAHPIGCYVSNNCGFRRETLQEVPIPEVDIRCACYFHAQRLARRGTPMWLVPEAFAFHEQQPIVRERSRRGYDMIAACWVDPEVREARWLRRGPLRALPRFYAANLNADWKRLWTGRKDLALSIFELVSIALLLPLFRMIDLAGMGRAMLRGPESHGWGGWEW